MYTGIVFDIVDEVRIESSPVIRATPEAAYQDALALVKYINENSADFNDRVVDETDAYVYGPSGIEWDYPRMAIAA